MIGGDLLERLLPIARDAGKLIMSIYMSDFLIRRKANNSPVTEADERAEHVIVEALSELTPDIPIVSEEAAEMGHLPSIKDSFWLVDPLDGTKEFVSRNGEFTVNIALIKHRSPVLGVVLAPALGRLFAGAQGDGAFVEKAGVRRPIQCRSAPPEGLMVVASRSHAEAMDLDEFCAGLKIVSLRSAGSSLKLCLVAAGEADLYPRLGRTMEWDIAAGDAILRAAGGHVRTLDRKILLYGKRNFANPHFYASADGLM